MGYDIPLSHQMLGIPEESIHVNVVQRSGQLPSVPHPTAPLAGSVLGKGASGVVDGLLAVGHSAPPHRRL